MYFKMKNNQYSFEVIIISVNLYDDSLLQKLKYWTEKTNFTVYNVDESRRLFEVIADKTDDKSIKLPIIAIRRSSGFTIKNPNKKPLTFDGLHSGNDNFKEYDYLKLQLANGSITQEEYIRRCSELKDISIGSNIISLNAIPVSIPYQVDVYTRYQKENDLYMRNLIFNFINYPTLQVQFNYNGVPIEHNGNIVLGETVSADQPSIKLFADQICRQTLSIVIDDAYLWDIRVRNSVSIGDGSILSIYDEKNKDFIKEQIS